MTTATTTVAAVENCTEDSWQQQYKNLKPGHVMNLESCTSTPFQHPKYVPKNVSNYIKQKHIAYEDIDECYSGDKFDDKCHQKIDSMFLGGVQEFITRRKLLEKYNFLEASRTLKIADKYQLPDAKNTHFFTSPSQCMVSTQIVDSLDQESLWIYAPTSINGLSKEFKEPLTLEQGKYVVFVCKMYENQCNYIYLPENVNKFKLLESVKSKLTMNDVINSVCGTQMTNTQKTARLMCTTSYQQELRQVDVNWEMFFVYNNGLANMMWNTSQIQKQYQHIGTVLSGSVSVVCVLPAAHFKIFPPLVARNTNTPEPFHTVATLVQPGMPLGNFVLKPK